MNASDVVFLLYMYIDDQDMLKAMIPSLTDFSLLHTSHPLTAPCLHHLALQPSVSINQSLHLNSPAQNFFDTLSFSVSSLLTCSFALSAL